MLHYLDQSVLLKKLVSNVDACKSMEDLLPIIKHSFELNQAKHMVKQRLNMLLNPNPNNQSSNELCLRKVFFKSSSLDEIVPKDILCKILEFVERKQLETLPNVSKHFYQTIYGYTFDNDSESKNNDTTFNKTNYPCPKMFKQVCVILHKSLFSVFYKQHGHMICTYNKTISI